MTGRPIGRFPPPPRTDTERAARDFVRRMIDDVGLAPFRPIARRRRAGRRVGRRPTCISHHHALLAEYVPPELRCALERQRDEAGET